MRRLLCLPALLGTAVLSSYAQSPKHLMMIVSKGLPGMTLYDADTDQLICRGTMPGIRPHEGAFSPDGREAYVPLYGTSGVGAPGTDEHMLYFYSTSDCKQLHALDTGQYKRPHGIEAGSSGTIYLTAEVAKSLILVDPHGPKIIASIPTDSGTSHMIAVSKDEKKIYVANVQSKTVSVLDVPGRKLAAVVPTGAEDQRMTLSPDGKWFVTNFGNKHEIAFYRTSDNQLDFTVPVDGVPFVAKFSADGKYLYDAGTENGDMRAWKIDVAQRKAVGKTDAEMGRAIGSLEVNPFTQKVYVSASDTDKITEIDPDSWKISKQFAGDKTPDCIVFTSVR